MSFSGILEDECHDPERVYGQNACGEGGEKKMRVALRDRSRANFLRRSTGLFLVSASNFLSC